MSEVLTIKGLSVSYGYHEALEDVSLSVEPGEYIGIIGPNGGGKTTLVSSVLGMVEKKEGHITLFGEVPEKTRHMVGYVPQSASLDRQFPITAKEAVMTAFLKKGLHPFRRFSEREKERADEILKKLELDMLSNRLLCELSGGEFQRLLIGRALAMEAKMLILDEPVASVDPASRQLIYRLLEELNREGMTILMVTHDLLAASASVKRIIYLDKTVKYSGAPEINGPLRQWLYGNGGEGLA